MQSSLRSLSFGPERIKRDLSPKSKENAGLLPPANDLVTVTTVDNSAKCEPNTPSVKDKHKRRRSALGIAIRVKSPTKDEENLKYSGNTDLNEKENVQMSQVNKKNESSAPQYLSRRGSCCSIESISSGRLSSDIMNEELKNRPWSIDDFSLGKPVGKGKFGNVYFGKEKRSKCAVALKVLFKAPMLTSDCVHNLRREVEIQCRLKHPNIVNLLGYFHDSRNVYLILEYLANGELYKSIAKAGGVVSETVCRTYMRDVTAAVVHMHSCHVVHRDIKPENILIGEDGTLKIADFGWAVHIPPPSGMRYTFCGTAEYLSPEMLQGKGHSVALDLWSLGVLMYEMLVGRTPFLFDSGSGSSRVAAVKGAVPDQLGEQEKIFSRIQSHDGGPLNYHGVEVTAAVQEIIHHLLQPRPEMRLSAAQLLGSEWVAATS